MLLDGKKIDFRDYPYQVAVYNVHHPQILLKTSRQVGKSVYDANLVISDGILTPFFKSLYVAPSKQQTSLFSMTKLSKILSYSPLIRNKYVRENTDNVFMKMFTNGSEIILNYACDDADRIRGITADRILLDEVQDMALSTVLPVIQEVSADSDYGYMTYTGTPKSMENGIEYLWQESTQAEWVIKCDGCGRWNYVDSVKSIGKKGPICVKCGHALRPETGHWHELNPITEDNPVRIKGYHVPQPILPKNARDPRRWDRIIEKMEKYGRTEFHNEVLGISDSAGSRLVTLEDLKALCKPYHVEDKPNPAVIRGCEFLCAGVDWSGGGIGHKSRTVLWIWGVTKGEKLRTVYFKIFPGRNQAEDVREVASMIQLFRAQLVCADAGEGAVANALLREIIGEHRVYPVQYGAVSKLMHWNGTDRWHVDKTAFIDSFMLLLKRGGAEFPVYEQSEQAFTDILAEYEETTQNGMGKKVWRHSPQIPDDSLHAMIFGWVATRLLRGEFKLY